LTSTLPTTPPWRPSTLPHTASTRPYLPPAPWPSPRAILSSSTGLAPTTLPLRVLAVLVVQIGAELHAGFVRAYCLAPSLLLIATRQLPPARRRKAPAPGDTDPAAAAAAVPSVAVADALVSGTTAPDTAAATVSGAEGTSGADGAATGRSGWCLCGRGGLRRLLCLGVGEEEAGDGALPSRPVATYHFAAAAERDMWLQVGPAPRPAGLIIQLWAYHTPRPRPGVLYVCCEWRVKPRTRSRGAPRRLFKPRPLEYLPRLRPPLGDPRHSSVRVAGPTPPLSQEIIAEA
jgi:hypothetical protein